jgi:transposase-like protein
MISAEIHRELSAICRQNVMSEGIIRQWRRMFKDGRTNVRAKGRSGQPSVVSDEMVRSVEQDVCEIELYTFRTFM